MRKLSFAEYIWLDGAKPTQRFRSKTRIVDIAAGEVAAPAQFPRWSFDGSSTYQPSAGFFLHFVDKHSKKGSRHDWKPYRKFFREYRAAPDSG